MPNNLIDLFRDLKAGRRNLSTDLPVYGDPNRTNPEGTWSWDSTHEIHGTCIDDLTLDARAGICRDCGAELNEDGDCPVCDPWDEDAFDDDFDDD